jgi:hypothetical protein
VINLYGQKEESLRYKMALKYYTDSMKMWERNIIFVGRWRQKTLIFGLSHLETP